MTVFIILLRYHTHLAIYNYNRRISVRISVTAPIFADIVSVRLPIRLLDFVGFFDLHLTGYLQIAGHHYPTMEYFKELFFVRWYVLNKDTIISFLVSGNPTTFEAEA